MQDVERCQAIFWHAGCVPKTRVLAQPPSLRELALGLFQVPFGLVQRCLERPWVDLEQKIAFVDIGAIEVVLLHQITGHFCADLRVDKPI
jgi:hypothetical protein